MKLRFPVNREGEDDVEADVRKVMRAYDDGESGLQDRESKERRQRDTRLQQRLRERKQRRLRIERQKLEEQLPVKASLLSKDCLGLNEYVCSACNVITVRRVPARSSCSCGCGFCGACCRGDSDREEDRSHCAPFIVLNIIAALAHLANFILAIAYANDDSKKRETVLQRFVTKWTKVEDYCSGNCTDPYYAVSNGEDDFIVNPFATLESISLNLFALVCAFHLLSFVFQMGVAVSPIYVQNVLEKGTNSWRFVEYSLSASIMLVCISIVSGILESNVLMCVAVLTFITQILGLISEQLFQDGIENQKLLRYFGWIAHFGGWVTMLTAYIAIIIVHFEESVRESEKQDDVEVPPFVIPAVWGVFVLYNMFGVTALCQLCLKDPWCGTVRERWNAELFGSATLHEGTENCAEVCGNRCASCIRCCRCCGYERMSVNEWVEMFYVILSLGSKTLLGTLILVNTLQEETAFGNIKTCDASFNASFV